MNSRKSSRSIVIGWSRCLCLLTATLILTGCATSKQPYKAPTLPADLAVECPPIPDFKSDSFDDLALAYIDLTSQYAECSARHDAVVQAWPKM